MTTEEIIADLRQNGLTSASIYTRMERAANRLEELQRDEAIAIARPEPSRLEIAAMLLAATYASNHVVLKAAHALQKADELIAAAKEVR